MFGRRREIKIQGEQQFLEIYYYYFNSLFTFSHLSTHFAWNSCEQGRTLTICLVSKSLMQTTHTVWPGSFSSSASECAVSVPAVSSAAEYLRWPLLINHSNNLHTEL